MNKRNQGFTLVEVLGVIGIVAVLFAVSSAIFVQAKESGHRTTCLSNIRQLGLASLMYSEQYDDRGPLVAYSYPTNSQQVNFHDLLLPYTGVYLHCPHVQAPRQTERRAATGYAINANLLKFNTRVSSTVSTYRTVRLSSIKQPSLLVMLGESSPGVLALNGPENWLLAADFYIRDVIHLGGALNTAGTRHQGGANYIFVDGHAKHHKLGEFVRPEDQNKIGFGWAFLREIGDSDGSGD